MAVKTQLNPTQQLASDREHYIRTNTAKAVQERFEGRTPVDLLTGQIAVREGEAVLGDAFPGGEFQIGMYEPSPWLFTRIGGTLDGQGSPITFGSFIDIGPIAYRFILRDWFVYSPVSGNITFDIRVDGKESYPPTVPDSIVGGGVAPNLTGQVFNESNDFALYSTVTIVPGDIVRFHASGATVNKATIILVGEKLLA